MDFSCLYHFDSPEYSLLEVRVNGLPSETPKQHRYHWLLVGKERQLVTGLSFVSMTPGDSEQSREFAEGSLRFSDVSAHYRPTLSATEIDLTPCSKEKLQPEIAGSVREFLERYLRSFNLLESSDRPRERPLQP